MSKLSSAQRWLLLLVFIGLHILNFLPGPMHWQGLLFGFMPIQFFFWLVINGLNIALLAYILYSADPYDTVDQSAFECKTVH